MSYVPVCNSIWVLCVTSRFLNFMLFLYFFLRALHFFHMNVLNLNVNWSRTFSFNTGSSCQHHLLLSMIVLLISLDSSLGEPLWSSYLQRKLGRVSLEHPLQPLSLHLWWAFCMFGWSRQWELRSTLFSNLHDSVLYSLKVHCSWVFWRMVVNSIGFY